VICCRPFRAGKLCGRLTQGVARRLALTLTIFFRAFSPFQFMAELIQISFLKQRLDKLFSVEGLKVVRLFAALHFACLNLSNSLSSDRQ
jgi:hypothetical protein